MGKFVDMTGWVMSEHGVPDSRLTVVEQTGHKNRATIWLCKCSCGNFCEKVGTAIRNGHTKSCGCLNVDKIISRNKTEKHPPRKQNKVEFVDDKCLIYDYNNNCCIIDKNDYDCIKQYCWYKDKRGYWIAHTHVDDEYNTSNIRIHRIILNVPDNIIVDHINHNKDDNRKCNIRIATHSQNSQNCVYKSTKNGVVGLRKTKNGWSARIKTNGRDKYIGSFKTKEEAIKARLLAEKKYFDEFAPQRHLFKEYGIDE